MMTRLAFQYIVDGVFCFLLLFLVCSRVPSMVRIWSWTNYPHYLSDHPYSTCFDVNSVRSRTSRGIRNTEYLYSSYDLAQDWSFTAKNEGGEE